MRLFLKEVAGILYRLAGFSFKDLCASQENPTWGTKTLHQTEIWICRVPCFPQGQEQETPAGRKFGDAFMSNAQYLKYSNNFPGYGIQVIRP